MEQITGHHAPRFFSREFSLYCFVKRRERFGILWIFQNSVKLGSIPYSYRSGNAPEAFRIIWESKFSITMSLKIEKVECLQMQLGAVSHSCKMNVNSKVSGLYPWRGHSFNLVKFGTHFKLLSYFLFCWTKPHILKNGLVRISRKLYSVAGGASFSA